MKILIFDSETGGHHLEYIHHLYDAVGASDHEAIILTAKSFEDVKEKFKWAEAPNIKVVYLSSFEQELCNNQNLLRSAWDKSIILRKYTKKYQIDAVWLIMLIKFMPFLPFLLPKKVKISGILYRIFLYNKELSQVRRFLEQIRFWIMSISSNIDSVFVLNDESAAEKLNYKFHTGKFKFIPDPFMEPDTSKLVNIRKQFCDSNAQKLWIHFGAIEERKGTLEILKAIALQKPDEAKMNKIVIAGRVFPEMKQRFYQTLNENPYKDNIYVYDEFCSYDFLYNLCHSCDAILIPYHNAIHSSGVIGYASYFEKPVVGPASGLLGMLIEKYKLGITLETIDPSNIYHCLISELPIGDSGYVRSHSPEEFANAFIKTLS